MPEDRSSLKELDRWVSYLMQCQQLPEGQVKTLCEKVGYQLNTGTLYLFHLSMSLKQLFAEAHWGRCKPHTGPT